MIGNNAARLMAVLLMLVMGSGCSVIMASSGNEEPNFGVIQPGATRAMVEGELGAPYYTDDNGSERTAWYEYELGNAPNGDRALANFALDVYSILLWEIIATPRELMMGDDYKMSVVYGTDNRVLSVNRSDPKVGEQPETASNSPIQSAPTTNEEKPVTGSVSADRPPSRPGE
jgi:hypothetical protein